MSDYAIEMIGITKSFPGVLANDDITLRVRDQEIHALLGENGAGKSTLMSILFGLYQADAGTIKVRGRPVQIRDPNHATALGIGMVHQHFKLVHNFTVTENIILGSEPRTKIGDVDIRSAERKVEELSRIYGLNVAPKALIEQISVGMQQRVEILKILYRNADILIFDEPTAVLTPQEIDELMQILRRLRNEGKTIILITHKLGEIKQVADRCTILRRGKVIDTVDVATTGEMDLAAMMVGRPVKFKLDKAPAQPGKVVLEIENLCVKGAHGAMAVQDCSLQVREGEIVGIAGVDGNGQSELVEALTGLRPIASGRIAVDGRDITRASIRERIDVGMGHIPEDRHKYGLVLKFRLDENLVLKTYRHGVFRKPLGMLDMEKVSNNAERLIPLFDIRAGQGPATRAMSMSGGNQQKAILAREIDLSPRMLVVAQPTRGLDVGAIENIHARLLAERDKGRAILLVSFELDEIMNLCDRIAAMSKGKIVGIMDAEHADEHRIGAMMAGYVQEEHTAVPAASGVHA
ncbi:MAG: ABC transporter ATP-binding protein [Spirochaetales bacterium]|nr:ABC transporter ATP-binding protein [Spirochaetales bacterium]